MQIRGFFSPLSRLNKPTGVGRHAIEMFKALSTQCQFALIGPQGEVSCPAVRRAGLGSNRDTILPFWDPITRIVFSSAGLLRVDRWIANADWIYSPREQPVRASKARVAVTVHDIVTMEPAAETGLSERSAFARAKLRMRFHQIDRWADAILFVSAFTKQRVIELGLLRDESRAHVIGSGIADAFFASDPEEARRALSALGIPARPYFLVPSSLTWRKGGDLVIELAHRLARQGKDLQLLVVGRRHDKDLVDQLSEARRANPLLPLRLLGYVDDAFLAGLMAGAEAVLLPSRYEGFGLPVLEAMAAGTLVVVSQGSALEESSGGLAITFARGDLEAFEDAIHRALTMPDRAALVEKGRAVAQGATWSACAARVISVLAG